MPSFPIPANCTDYIDGVIDCSTLANLRKSVKQYPDLDENPILEFEPGSRAGILLLETSGEDEAFFVHAAGNQVQLWSLAFRRDGIYELWGGEAHSTIIPSFEDKADYLLDHLQFYWAMKELIKDTIRDIDDLTKIHAQHQSQISIFSGGLHLDSVDQADP
ncbi:unnamed protein product [Absidia cylindrospora]